MHVSAPPRHCARPRTLPPPPPLLPQPTPAADQQTYKPQPQPQPPPATVRPQVIDGQHDELRGEALNAVCAMAVVLGQDFAMFTPTIAKVWFYV